MSGLNNGNGNDMQNIDWLVDPVSDPTDMNNVFSGNTSRSG